MASQATKRGRPADEGPPEAPSTAARGRFEPGALRTEAFKRLKHGACADAYHDFKSKGFNRDRTTDVRKPGLADVLLGLDGDTGTPVNSIPTASGAEKLRIENDMLLDLFAGTGLTSDRLVRSILQDSIGTAPQYEKSYRLNGLYGAADYRVRLLAKGNQPNVQALLTTGGLTVGDIINLLSPTPGAASYDLNLVVDMAIISLLDFFKSLRDDGSRELRVNFLVNRELVNDPAPKTYEDTRKPPSSSNVKLHFLYDAGNDPITYSHNTRALGETELERDKFFSKFDFHVGPLQMVSNRLPTLTVDIVHDQKKIYHNTDPHENNAITHCWKRILSVFKSRAAKHQEAAANFQCKRSGDWLQALSCFDMGREYRNTTTTAVSKLSGTSIVLVTHDVVLLWYALFMGVNVLFTTKTNPDPSASDEPDSVDEEAVDDGRSPKYILYFQALKNIETPIEKAERLLEECRRLTEGGPLEEVFARIRAYRDAYAAAAEAIQRDTFTTIRTLAALEPRGIVDLTNLLNSILRAYYKKQSFKIRLESPEWMEQILQTPTLQEVYTTPSSIRTLSDDALHPLISVFERLVSKLTDYTVRMKTVPQDQLQAYLEITHSAYMKDDLYASLPGLLSIQRSSRKSNEIARALELIDVIQTAMHSLTEQLEFYQILSSIRKNPALRKDTPYVIDACLDALSKHFLTVYDQPDTSAAERSALQEGLRANPPLNEGIRRDVEQMFLQVIEHEQTELVETVQEGQRLTELPETRDNVAQEFATETAEFAATAAQEEAAGKQTKFKFAKAFPSLGSIFRTLAGRAQADLTGAPPPGEPVRGGGLTRNRSTTNSYRILVAAYLRELQQTILTLDYTDPDAVFYDCAARLALSVLGPDPKRAAEALYGTLPTADFQTLGLFQSKSLAEHVAFAARQVALRALGLRTTGTKPLLPAVSLTAAELQTYRASRKLYTPRAEERQLQLALTIGRAVVTVARAGQNPVSKTRKGAILRTKPLSRNTSKRKQTSQRKRASATRRTKRPSAVRKQLLGQTRRATRGVAALQPN